MQNLKTRIQILLEIRLEEMQSGAVRLNVSNQFDETVIESALANFDNFEALAEVLDTANLDAITPMSWAHNLSAFQPAELSAAWIN